MRIRIWWPRDREIRSKVLRAMVVDVVAADRNCTKHIKPRWDKEQVDERIDLYRADIRALKEELEAARVELQSARAELRDARKQRERGC